MRVGAVLTFGVFVACFGSLVIATTTGWTGPLFGWMANPMAAILALIAIWTGVFSILTLRTAMRFAKRFVKPS
jgi:succinate-acetate transporter protein